MIGITEWMRSSWGDDITIAPVNAAQAQRPELSSVGVKTFPPLR